jgi:hypothetical protein
MVALSRKARLAIDLRDTWQGRCAIAARGRTAMVLMSALCHSYEEAAPILYALVFPDHGKVMAPYLESCGRIAKNGTITAKVRRRDGSLSEQVLYRNELALRDEFRKLADQLKLGDADRVEMFGAIQRWVVADRRLDPAMDPKDPAARRLVH